MEAYNCHSIGKIVSRLLLLLCRLIIYDPLICRLPLILIIASASRAETAHTRRDNDVRILNLRSDVTYSLPRKTPNDVRTKLLSDVKCHK